MNSQCGLAERGGRGQGRGEDVRRRRATACDLTVEALASSCTHNLPCGLMPLLHRATVADLLPADVPALSRGESHHKTRLRKERPVPAVGIEKVCGLPPASDAWASELLSCLDSEASDIVTSICRSPTPLRLLRLLHLGETCSASVQPPLNRWFEEFPRCRWSSPNYSRSWGWLLRICVAFNVHCCSSLVTSWPISQ